MKSSRRDDKESNGMETGEKHTDGKTEGIMGGPDPDGFEENECEKYVGMKREVRTR